MLIRNDLPQFHSEPTLLLVTGREVAQLYHVADGELEQRESFEVEPPDNRGNRPGHFEEGAHGDVYSAGTAFDPKELKRQARDRLLHQLPDHIKTVAGDTPYHHVFIFTPDYMHEDVEQALPYPLGEKLAHVFYGNFTKHDPQDLLEKISGLEPDPADTVPPHKQEVKKILERYRQFHDGQA